MSIICIIAVTVYMGNIPFMVSTQASGKIIKAGSSAYIVDFSKMAKEKNWDGDYSEVFVEKEKCIE